jgi:hypothetical protein
MAQLITPNPSGDSVGTIADKTRDLPANQGLNNYEMWVKIDTEIASAITAGKCINPNDYLKTNKHGLK